MANLTLRQTAPGSPKPNITYKGSPLSHVELDANFTALDSAISGGSFDSGLEVSGGINVNTGDLVLNNGNLVLNDGDIKYNPKLKFHDDVSNTDTMAIDSTGALLVGTMNNAQSVKMKVARTGNQHTLVGSLVSNSGQTTRAEYGPAGGTADTGSGLKATQMSSNFIDWSLALFASNSTDGYVDGLTINKDGTANFHHKVTFEDSVQCNAGINVSGDLNVSGDILSGGSPIASGTVSSVAMTVPTGFSISGSPITTSGTLALAMDAGYSIPQSSSQTNWNTAYGWGDHSTAGYASASRSINTTNGIQGGGNLTADRTLSLTGSYTGTWAVTGGITATGNITTDGAITAQGDVTAFSDIAIKENIDPISDALDKVSQLGGYVFNRKGDDSRRYTGVMAQEVKSVLPEAVHGEEGNYSVAYGNMVGLLVEAIKELKAEIEELKKG